MQPAERGGGCRKGRGQQVAELLYATPPSLALTLEGAAGVRAQARHVVAAGLPQAGVETVVRGARLLVGLDSLQAALAKLGGVLLRRVLQAPAQQATCQHSSRCLLPIPWQLDTHVHCHACHVLVSEAKPAQRLMPPPPPPHPPHPPHTHTTPPTPTHPPDDAPTPVHHAITVPAQLPWAGLLEGPVEGDVFCHGGLAGGNKGARLRHGGLATGQRGNKRASSIARSYGCCSLQTPPQP